MWIEYELSKSLFKWSNLLSLLEDFFMFEMEHSFTKLEIGVVKLEGDIYPTNCLVKSMSAEFG